jgi:uncharacterized protein (DUF58 family)
MEREDPMEPDGGEVVRTLRPTGWVPILAWLGLAFMQIVSPDRAWSWLLVGLSLLLVISFVWARRLRDRVFATRVVEGTWVVAGDELRERFTLVNTSRLPVLWAQVSDRSAVPGYSANRVESVSGDSERSWTGTGVCRRRGVFRLGPWDLVMADPLGLFEVIHHYPVTATLMVYPRASFLPHLELPRGRTLGRAMSSERTTQETILVGGVRDYNMGDSLRRIHWPKSAHHDRLMVREFDREPSGDVWLVLDLDTGVQAGDGAEATQEYGVILAASLAARFTREGERRAVGLLMAGTHPAALAPARGQSQLWRILRVLAEAEPSPETSLAALLRQTGTSLGSGRTLVVITPSPNPEWVAPLIPLMARGNAPSVLLLNPTTFSPPRGEESEMVALRSLLSRQQIPHYVVQQGFPFQPVERIKRQRSDLRTLSGTGRVIQVQIEEEV